MIRKLLKVVITVLFRLLTRLNVSGVENIPVSGGAILAINHLSRIDAPLVFMHLERQDVSGLVAKKYQAYPLMRFIVNQVPGIWVNRDNPEPEALRQAVKFLRDGGMLGIAPEGTRSSAAGLLPGKPGVAFLATKAAVPIIPIAAWGTEHAIADLKKFRRPEVHLRFGKPFSLPPLDRKNRDASLQQNADEIMVRIGAMMPQAYWGAYNGHPRLAEFIKGEQTG